MTGRWIEATQQVQRGGAYDRGAWPNTLKSHGPEHLTAIWALVLRICTALL